MVDNATASPTHGKEGHTSITDKPRPASSSAQAPAATPTTAVATTRTDSQPAPMPPTRISTGSSTGDLEHAHRTAHARPQPLSSGTRYSGRIGGLDIARALAILGMFYAHTAPRLGEPGTIQHIVSDLPVGRSSILFAVLAGISLAILTGRNIPYTGERMRVARLRIFGRATALLVVTGILSLLGTSIALILSFYAAWFICALPFTGWSAKRLFVTAGILAILGPLAHTTLNWLFASLSLYGSGSNAFVVEVFVTGIYPGLVFMAFILAGMGVGRLDITRRKVHGLFLAVGAALMAVGYGASWILGNTIVDRAQQAANGVLPNGLSGGKLPGSPPPIKSLTPDQLSQLGDLGDLTLGNGNASILPNGFDKALTWQPVEFPSLGDLVTAEPHTSTIFEALGSGGFALAVIGLCLLIGGLSRTLLFPLAAVGSMSLTAYSAHVVAIAIEPDWSGSASWHPFLILSAAVIVGCSLWKVIFQRGPLEWVTWKVSMLTARTSNGDDAEALAGSAR
ncbi:MULTISPECIES: heparan-alpha-glucosaminide N-acetyltransferase domain-containing protein [unclassified Actinobaculum]|uniref:heparan-alpha-glucosaminide N-acetyltransferase domain-containing protein n=1 Tax=unclassified Actinobaculum TaxID=2609299 RepID=UPI000D527DDC|nr:MULTISPECIES: heparan-alpha-glucosaminide N-acetyltransferase domain-containing protein [unclassified Actinobaculum]AWE41480.1 hypothetical protein DDD63_00405 [Actinobaculum sp. 313]RTE48189.1 DUF1624 domain-containing protein [Actinobaculum sp. 352]